ncbi:hypothetical protein INH39_30805 [Massilia violaceinigra]|uniref:Uncharacterized protein n=1 Tax=Massilia violaceinigra TaxID=2045208 RepID=A0ABY4AAV7_9BURK|nr:hypothetical protein [Massilia violaceinigra]UOD29723.1 hypothetical protein INH39_30805 [Massilia violaceinigra]
MFLKTEKAEIPMKLVFQLSTELRRDPERVAKIQALTKDASRPSMGYKGMYGLYNSEEWWENIRNGSMPSQYVSGVIQFVGHAGQEGNDTNSFVLLLDDGSTRFESIYCNIRRDMKFFRVGCRVDIFSVFDPPKVTKPLSPGAERSKIVIEMAVSTMPVASIIEEIET